MDSQSHILICHMKHGNYYINAEDMSKAYLKAFHLIQREGYYSDIEQYESLSQLDERERHLRLEFDEIQNEINRQCSLRDYDQDIIDLLRKKKREKSCEIKVCIELKKQYALYQKALEEDSQAAKSLISRRMENEYEQVELEYLIDPR